MEKMRDVDLRMSRIGNIVAYRLPVYWSIIDLAAPTIIFFGVTLRFRCHTEGSDTSLHTCD